jgi:SAM-dependent methyltransferase
VHRRLRGDDGALSGDVLHERLLAAIDATAGRHATPVVLDAGCGLGGTVFFLQPRLGGQYRGITLSPDQAARATAEAARRGVVDRCHFAVRDYDGDLADLLPDGADLIVAIESLAHAPSPSATIARLAAHLRPEGRLLIVDDVPDTALPAADRDFTGFRAGWHAPAVANAAALAAAIDGAGLVRVFDEDLTARVPRRSPLALSTLLMLARVAGPLARLTPAGVLHDALVGGLWLERLYARGVIRYRLIVARRGGRR